MVLLGHVADVRAVGAVDRHAAAAGDVADDLVGRHGMAAAGELREKRIDAHDEHVALARVAGLADEDLVGLGRDGLGRLHSGGERRLRDLLLAVCKAELVDALIAEALGEILELDRSLAEARKLLVDLLAALGGELRSLLGVEPLADLVAGARTGRKALLGGEPVAGRLSHLGGDDLDGLARLELGVERHEHAVDLCALGAVAELRVHGIGEVDGRAPAGQLDHAALRRERIDVVVEHGLALGLALVLHVAAPGEQLAKPGDALLLGARRAVGVARLLVAPVRGHAELCELMHGAGADLDLERTARLVGHDRVKRLVAVGLGLGDVVVVLLRNHGEVLVHDGEHLVAALDRVDNDAHGAHVEELIKAQVLALHLLPDRIDVLRTSRDFGLDAVLLKKSADAQHGALHELDALLARFVELLCDLTVFGRARETQRQVLELPLELPDAEAVGQRCVKVERLGAELLGALALRGGEPAQRLQAARKLEKDDAQVLAHRKEHAAHGLHLMTRVRLLVFGTGAAGKFVHLSELLHEPVDGGTEALFDPFAGILDHGRHAEKIGCADEFRIVPDLSENACDAVGMLHDVLTGRKGKVAIERLDHAACKRDVHDQGRRFRHFCFISSRRLRRPLSQQRRASTVMQADVPRTSRRAHACIFHFRGSSVG